jgi:hypothetical protein
MKLAKQIKDQDSQNSENLISSYEINFKIEHF